MAKKKCPNGKTRLEGRCVRKKSHWVRNWAILGGIWCLSAILVGNFLIAFQGVEQGIWWAKIIWLPSTICYTLDILPESASASLILLLVYTLLGVLVGYTIRKVKGG